MCTAVGGMRSSASCAVWASTSAAADDSISGTCTAMSCAAIRIQRRHNHDAEQLINHWFKEAVHGSIRREVGRLRAQAGWDVGFE
jgi:hypothetical protein